MNNTIFPNKFKAALAAQQIQIGCWSALASPISTEVLGLAGFDWLVLDGEHAPNDISTFIPQLMALKGSDSAAVVRVPTNEPVIIKRLLDIGFYNFLIPFVETEEEAVNAVASTRYPPEGIRGVSVSHRANMFGTVPDYFAQSNKNITIIVQIESQQGVDNVDAIAATEGVDGVFVGPSDLAAALGHLGNASHPDVHPCRQCPGRNRRRARKGRRTGRCPVRPGTGWRTAIMTRAGIALIAVRPGTGWRWAACPGSRKSWPFHRKEYLRTCPSIRCRF